MQLPNAPTSRAVKAMMANDLMSAMTDAHSAMVVRRLRGLGDTTVTDASGNTITTTTDANGTPVSWVAKNPAGDTIASGTGAAPAKLNWWQTLTTPAKVGVGVGAAIAVLGLGYGVLAMLKKRRRGRRR